MRESKDWTAPIGQNGGKGKAKLVSEAAVMTRKSYEWKGCNDKLTAELRKECRDAVFHCYRIA